MVNLDLSIYRTNSLYLIIDIIVILATEDLCSELH